MSKRRMNDGTDREEAADGPLAGMATRRAFVRAAVHTIAGAALLAACGDPEGRTATAGRPGGGTGGAGGAGGVGGSGGNGGSGGGGASAWATGGTAAMVDPDAYPDPFASGGGACALTCAMTLGPCFGLSPIRRDVSEGYPGIPLRLVLRLVDVDGCTPVEGATVDVWHCSAAGLYSGDDVIDFCTTGDPDARSHRFFRGTQSSDADGRVTFDTCFPGWYPGRAVHIHFRVVRGDEVSVVSQVFFPGDLVDEVFASVDDYVEAGAPDTSNEADGFLGASSDPDAFILDVARMADGAMLASKTVVLRSSTSAPQC
ncbi:protocatechuate 3,4-dioxygenase [Vulgatibacter sp.]|uniref:dioxygenase family protein n=1 Tax=Vulgatibacter sp. TaxID=1971226 RepID=UPI00356551C7